ncbi:MAG: phospholipase [Muribaculum sp.]|nr:phospholipase [Muribaculum sp.]
MEVIIIISSVLVAVGVALWCHDRLTRSPKAQADEPVETVQTDSENEECCGMHITCERDSLLASVSDTIEYYDDEELDRFIGREPDSYDDDEIEEFRDVLLTLLPEDIAGWGRSIQLRGIRLPDPVRDELLMIVAEARREAALSTAI